MYVFVCMCAYIFSKRPLLCVCYSVGFVFPCDPLPGAQTTEIVLPTMVRQLGLSTQASAVLCSPGTLALSPGFCWYLQSYNVGITIKIWTPQGLLEPVQSTVKWKISWVWSAWSWPEALGASSYPACCYRPGLVEIRRYTGRVGGWRHSCKCPHMIHLKQSSQPGAQTLRNS